jgi:hypothetical protein
MHDLLLFSCINSYFFLNIHFYLFIKGFINKEQHPPQSSSSTTATTKIDKKETFQQSSATLPSRSKRPIIKNYDSNLSSTDNFEDQLKQLHLENSNRNHHVPIDVPNSSNKNSSSKNSPFFEAQAVSNSIYRSTSVESILSSIHREPKPPVTKKTAIINNELVTFEGVFNQPDPVTETVIKNIQSMTNATVRMGLGQNEEREMATMRLRAINRSFRTAVDKSFDLPVNKQEERQQQERASRGDKKRDEVLKKTGKIKGLVASKSCERKFANSSDTTSTDTMTSSMTSSKKGGFIGTFQNLFKINKKNQNETINNSNDKTLKER